MRVNLEKIPLSRLGKPLRACDPVNAACVLGVHGDSVPKRGKYGWIEPCEGHTTFNGRGRPCMCNCHTERKG